MLKRIKNITIVAPFCCVSERLTALHHGWALVGEPLSEMNIGLCVLALRNDVHFLVVVEDYLSLGVPQGIDTVEHLFEHESAAFLLQPIALLIVGLTAVGLQTAYVCNCCRGMEEDIFQAFIDNLTERTVHGLDDPSRLLIVCLTTAEGKGIERRGMVVTDTDAEEELQQAEFFHVRPHVAGIVAAGVRQPQLMMAVPLADMLQAIDLCQPFANGFQIVEILIEERRLMVGMPSRADGIEYHGRAAKGLEAWIDQMQKNGKHVDLNVINAHLSEMMSRRNAAPRQDFHGFSPEQMHIMLDLPFSEHCPVKIRQLNNEEMIRIPLMRQVLHLMGILSKGEVKLTAQGYIPPKIVGKLYGMGSHSWLSDSYKQHLESNTEEIRVLRVILKGCGLVKTRLGKMSLTTKGKKMLHDHNALMKDVLLFLMTSYNVAWLDAHDDDRAGNIGRLYSLWLLHHYGDQWRDTGCYASDYEKAFPTLDANRGYPCRVFERLFRLIGICEINDTKEWAGKEWGHKTRKTDVLEQMFSFEEPQR